ncbi:unnamed protein product [Gongylonema pulchrum]|uniref:Uncharacterized protein n=1 Tax=Gongylonema pulchrum TaxID=637853 RepID=A0A3P6RM24_9BILA|nr:unnamed protein product [Gongylonema pulchrum]
MENPTGKQRRKPLTRQAQAKKILKKGVRVNVRKVFTDDGLEEETEHGTAAADRMPGSEDGGLGTFDVNEAKREMERVDQQDKLTYKEKMKKWKKVLHLFRDVFFIL